MELQDSSFNLIWFEFLFIIFLHLFQDPVADFQIPLKGIENWFAEELVLNKRREIHELIMDLHRRYQSVSFLR